MNHLYVACSDKIIIINDRGSRYATFHTGPLVKQITSTSNHIIYSNRRTNEVVAITVRVQPCDVEIQQSRSSVFVWIECETEMKTSIWREKRATTSTCWPRTDGVSVCLRPSPDQISWRWTMKESCVLWAVWGGMSRCIRCCSQEVLLIKLKL